MQPTWHTAVAVAMQEHQACSERTESVLNEKRSSLYNSTVKVELEQSGSRVPELFVQGTEFLQGSGLNLANAFPAHVEGFANF